MSVDFLWSVVQVGAGFALAVALGFGPSFWLLPGAARRFALLAAPAAGFALFSLATIVASANLHLPANTAVWIALALLAVISLSAFLAAHRGGALPAMWGEARAPAIATLVMLVAMFWPVLYQGTSLYLGTANIDFYQSLSYQEVLTRYNIGALDPRPAIDWSLDPFFGSFPDPVPAKFGGVMFSMLLAKLLGLEPRTALMTAVVTFVLAMPAATYMFARTALDMDARTSALSAFLIAMSGPVAMSFVHVLVGQNSSLALLPLGLAVCYLAVRARDWRVMLLAFLLIDAVFWMYVAMLPYIGAPVGLYALYDLARNRRGAVRWLLVASVVLAAGFAILQIAMVPETRQLVDDMRALLGRANRVVYVDYLTEIALPHSLGLASYPITSSVLFSRVAPSNYLAWAGVFVALSFAVLAFYFRSVVAWARRAAAEPRFFALGMLGVYLAVWLYFNFVSQYGYAIFKMASWLQFLFVPFIAYGLAHFVAAREGGRLDFAAAAAIGGLAVVANVIATVDFGVKGLGDDTHRGALVNSYGIGGNTDYMALETELPRAVPKGSVIGIAMPDYIANLWTSYYVQRGGMRASLVSHDDFPDEDAVLPDIATGRVINSAGTSLVYKPRYHADDPPYLLLEGPQNLNREIADQKAVAPPLWSDGTFVLVESARARDVLVTARGFYRLEYFDRDRFAWWWPERMRWTAEGGEFLLLHASKPGAPHRISFLVIAGTQRERPRHLEIWVNGRMIDAMEVRGAARVLSKPFHPTGGIDKIVVRVRERVEVPPRNYGLWNRQIAIDTRRLNMVMTQARLSREGDAAAEPARGTMNVKAIIDRSREFDGISMDGWVSPDARLVLPVANGASRARLRIEVPGWANYKLPLRVAADANGGKREFSLDRAGSHDLEWALPPGAPELAVRLESSQSTTVPGTGAASFRIESLAIE